MFPIVLRRKRTGIVGSKNADEQHNGQRENGRVEAFLSQDFLVGMEVGEWVHGLSSV
jgi:hypothetical protein